MAFKTWMESWSGKLPMVKSGLKIIRVQGPPQLWLEIWVICIPVPASSPASMQAMAKSTGKKDVMKDLSGQNIMWGCN